LTVTNSVISGNSAGETGGGIAAWNAATTTVTNSTISDNLALGHLSSLGGGAGIFNYYGTLTVMGSTISENSANYDGGGVLQLWPGDAYQ